MKYSNPVLSGDYSDPDVIRVGEDFYMIASSFNHLPGVPVLHSKNLAEWEIINHIIKEMPFPRFEKVCHGEGAWAPALRYRGGKFYALIPFPEEGIFVSETEDIYGEWSPLRPLLKGAGYEDPCPIWADGKCYVAFAFVRSRIGFNSRIAVFEADEELTRRTSDYSIIYNEPNISPIIEGPKFYKRGKYFYILAPAGGVGTGWQVALRSENVYGPYETKIIMTQGDSGVNGPHQGALVDLDDKGERWAFLHFQRKGAWGRVVHLQPAVWRDDWAICGAETYDNLPGTPVPGGDYPVDIATDYKITPTDYFNGGKLSLVWQTPANMKSEWYDLKQGLKLNCAYYGGKTLSLLPQLFMQKIQYLNFDVKTECVFDFKKNGARAGFTVFGKEYRYISAVRRGGEIFIEIKKGNIDGEEDEVLLSCPCTGDRVCFGLKARYEERDRLSCRFTLNGKTAGEKFYASAGVWVGAKLGVFALTSAAEDKTSSAKFRYFKVVAK